MEWIVNDTPDTVGTFSGYPTNQLTNIIVNRIVSSKVDNFLKPNQSLGGNDGYYFHINSYDWLKATAPIGVPTTLAGVAIERGITSIATVSAATNATPIVLTTSAHGITVGAQVMITVIGVLGNVAANGTFPAVATTGTSFSLIGSEGSGAYTSGGTIYTPTDFSTLTWDETNNSWRMALNTSGNGLTLGASQNLRVLNSFVDGYASLGTTAHGTTTVAATGTIRFPNNQFMIGRNVGLTADISMIGIDTLNRIKIGAGVSDLVYLPGNLDVDGYIVHDGTGTNVPLTGFIREQNGTNIIAVRNQAGTLDIVVLSTTAANRIVLGDAVNAGTVYNTATGGLHAFQINSVSTIELGDVYARFTAGVVAPTIMQVTAGAGQTGQTLTLQAQNGGTGSTTGGIAQVMSGTGSSFSGTVDLSTGGVVKVRVHPTTAPAAANNSTIELFNNNLRFDDLQTLPFIFQETTAGATATHLTVQAQNAATTGGNLLLSSGTGAGTAGNVIIKTGNTNQIIVTPTLTTILGNLLVNGTTTSVASTVVEIADRVINLNSSANQFPGTTVPLPTQLTGFAVDRGSTDNTTKRAYHGLFWSETDSYWRFAVNTDGYTAQNVLTTTLPVIGSHFLVQPSASVPVTAALIPTVGGFRTLNNTVSLASRNAAGTQDLIQASTDSTNHLIWGSPTQNAGHIFNTTTSTIYDFQVNSVSTYQIQPISNGTTTLQATSGVTALVYNQATTGSATGAPTTLQAQNAATTGGALILTSGTGATTAGNLQLQTGAVDRVVVHPDFTEFRDTAEALRITPVSAGTTLITYASTVTTAQIDQTATGSATGALMFIKAQNAATTGGELRLSSGTGGTTAGNANIQTGGVTKVSVNPTFTTFNDTAEAVRITPVSAGTTQVTFATGITSVSFNQTATGGATGAPWTIQAQTGASGTGGAISLIAGNATTTGGNAIVSSGTGATAGNVNLQTGAVTRVSINPTFTTFNDTVEALRVTPVSSGTTQITYASTVTAAQINQTATAGATGAPMTHQAQNAVTTGGALNLSSGTGVTAGNTNLQTGAVTRVSVNPTFTTFNDTIEALRVTPVSSGSTLITFASTVTAATVNQTTTGGATGANLTIQAQNAVTTGGNAVITSGTGATAGNVQLQTGAVDRIIVHPTYTEFRDMAEAVRIVPVSSGISYIQFASTVTTSGIAQADTVVNAATGAPLAVIAQHATGTTTVGGALLLSSGTGTTTNGAVNLQVGTVTTASLVTNKFVFNKGRRRNVTQISSAGGTYAVLATNDYIAITTVAASFTINLPTTPTLGDTYEIKDTTGNASPTFVVTIGGNGTNIDGAASIPITTGYAAVTVTYTGTQWSLS